MPRTLAQNAQYIAETIKPAIKSAIEAQGVTVPSTDSFLDYADRIGEIEGGGGGGGRSAIDTSKADYQIGTGYIGLYGGRLLKGFAAMDSKCAFPVVGLNNADMGVPWNDSFEIGARFKFIEFPTYQSIIGDGNYGSYRKSPRILYSNNEGKLWLCISSNGSTLAINEPLDYTIALDTWYFVKLKFVKSTMNITVDITEDFETYVNLYNDTMSATPYYDSSAYLSIGGEARSADMASNTFLIDTFNTYVKDATGSIAWGCFEGQGAEYELWDYIESDGTQVIDLGFAPKNGDEVTVSNMLLSAQSTAAFVWGATDNSAYLGVVQESNFKTIYTNSTSGSSYPSYIKNQLNIDTLTANRDYTNHLCMFGFYIDGAYAHSISTRIYFAQCNDNYYLPCRRKSDGVFGLWDVANQKFIGDSAGGNAFVGGSCIGNLNIYDAGYVDGVAYQSVGDCGTAGYTNIKSADKLMGATSITFEVYARIDSYVNKTSGAYARLMEFGNSQQSGRLGFVGLASDNDNNLCYWDDTADVASGIEAWTLGDTHLISVVKTTAGALKIYIDGVLKYTGSSTLTITTSIIDYVTERGGYSSQVDSARQLNGEIYAWRIYAKELSTGEIKQNLRADIALYN